ncbi:MAG: WecB/TagA/CpsF family glycosyltransferase [Bacteroidetes bacterium]|nr:WecB/TagA/CpsF family glycosyltransferase [Bacteroidota bacterium]
MDMRIEYYGLQVDDKDTDEVLNWIDTGISENKQRSIFFINAHCFNISCENAAYKEALNESDLVLNDGIGIKLGGILKGIHFKENMNGTDLIPRILNYSTKHHRSVFLLGALDEVVKKAIDTIRQNYPDIILAGYNSGYFNDDEAKQILEKINALNTDILIVGMGVPKQELWIKENRKNLPNVKILIAGGAVFDFLSQKFKRAPKFLRLMGLEWFFRFLQEPGRLFKRYFIGNIRFFRNILSRK